MLTATCWNSMSVTPVDMSLWLQCECGRPVALCVWRDCNGLPSHGSSATCRPSEWSDGTITSPGGPALLRPAHQSLSVRTTNRSIFTPVVLILIGCLAPYWACEFGSGRSVGAKRQVSLFPPTAFRALLFYDRAVVHQPGPINHHSDPVDHLSNPFYY